MRTRVRGALLLAAVALASTTPAVAGATDDIPASVVTQAGPHGGVRTAGGGKDRALLAGLDTPPAAPLGGAPAPANRNQQLASSARQSCGSGDVVVSGGSYVVVPYLNYYAVFTTNASKTAWTGAVPMVADSVTQQDVWRIDFFGDGFGVTGLPEGATTHGDGGSLEVDWTTTAKNAWYAEHTWDKLQFVPKAYFGQIYRIRHTVTATFRFGTRTCTVTTEARSYVW
jgi:hypothetical protein